MAAYFEAGCKPADAFRIGTEHEKFGFRHPGSATARWSAPAYEPRGIHAMLSGIAALGWEAILDQDQLIGLKKAGESVSLEPGGQFELSGAPLASLHETAPSWNAISPRCARWASRSASASPRWASTRWRAAPTCRSCPRAATPSCDATCRWSAAWGST